MAKWLTMPKWNRIECCGIAAGAIGISEKNWWKVFILLAITYALSELAKWWAAR